MDDHVVRLRETVAKLLHEVYERDDPSLALDGQAAREARDLRKCLRPDDGDLTSRLLLGWFYWYRFQASDDHPMEDLSAAFDLFKPVYLDGELIDQLPERTLPALADQSLADLSALTESGLDTTEAWRRAVELLPDHPQHADIMANLAVMLFHRYEREGDVAALDESIGLGRMAVAGELVDRPGVLDNVEMALQARVGSAPELLEELIGVLEELVELAPDEVARRGRLAIALQERYMRVGELDDLDRAIAMLRTVRDQGNALAHLLWMRFDRTGRRDDLREARGLAGGPDAFGAHTLGMILQSSFSLTGELDELDAAVGELTRAYAGTPMDDPDFGLYACNLGNALRLRFEAGGALTDLDEAVRVCRESVEATPGDNPRYPYYASTLGGALQLRADRVDSAQDLDAAVVALRAAVRAAGDGHPDWAMFGSNLAGALRARNDLDEAIDLLRRAVTAVPGQPRLGQYWNNLSDAMRSRFEATGEAADLEEAVRAGRTAILLTPADQPGRAAILYSHARVLQAGGQAEEALRHAEQALGTEMAPATWKLRAAWLAGDIALTVQPERAAELLERAVRLLPEIAPRHLRREDQQYALGRTSGLVADAAALALTNPATPESERPARALELLEIGRSVLFSQALQTRGDLSALSASHPRLVERFTRLRDLLDLDPSPIQDRERRTLAAELSRLVTEIGALSGRTDLRDQAGQGPVVTFNVSRHRSDALLLTETGVAVLPLPALTFETVLDQVTALYRALEVIARGGSAARRLAAERDLCRILGWLWDAAAGPVLGALGPVPRVWWATGGLLGLLPVHAAGQHSAGDGRTVLDRVVSSYTPTIAALRHARRESPPALTGQTLVVAMPTTPGASELAFVPDEVDLLSRQLPDVTVLDTPTGDEVLNHLPSARIAHFACHAVSDPDDPSRSRLLLQDHEVAPLTVTRLGALRLDQAVLAYLSACETAVTRNLDLLEESIHLATAFQLAGYRQVVGTLWRVDDWAAGQLAGAFYAAMIDGVDAAEGVRHAVRALRDQSAAMPSLWAAHLHVGA
ncbi:CHAT domain-containing tetratricopeptide repeat protein [Nonomuraea angiospora]|uniref:CHAT domain-containing protein n=1 Tax=Nonomuraea angiospora TaxID=46172 RepID=UPI0034308D7B